MYRGTTPTLIFNLSSNPNLDLSEVAEVWVTLKYATYTKNWERDERFAEVKNESSNEVLLLTEKIEKLTKENLALKALLKLSL